MSSGDPLADLAAAAARTRPAPAQPSARQSVSQPAQYQLPSPRSASPPGRYAVGELVRAGFWLGVGAALAALCVTVLMWVLTFVGCAAILGGLSSQHASPPPSFTPFGHK